MREQEVTLAIEKYLRKKNWEILSLNNPFSGKSVWIKPIGGFRGKGTLIPDIIARKEKIYLIVESYEKLKIKDIGKLEKYSKPEYLDSIKEIFDEESPVLVKAMSYPEPIKLHGYPKDFIVFGIDNNYAVSSYIGKDNYFFEKREFINSNKNIFI
ncbi:hypothetical protein A2531_01805 [Candidatus Falkowbacteria bacterium RIFOXYD2_FULL_34_120]|uniref:Uncharacterized protein n=1 Tax=Candidatus Falkowbacteria bacterium RIFOXYD2_FULL_34_120 TaxID=1798007 RepID=A0A1F5TN70_9BACT|nr:MAG: hypothetical protein A2500_05885 [Candidatus Falkowbacteria bacterium RIFOXYC12_FULL_34_55]OGF36819.1 MAG: hypothetical protein A2466_04465 [Candidatus Falkowbacteria bacterium RIFOXYC2_FULL_34_220]OGF38707.1 MAG: hypothetical protein A2515_01550 [Candidatus Falkowbacteria bacterium RIFOXYD12_FULL_34_57]OGF39941.1 MAG: hypothetical protein A2531_01805 [Candidatus Falkowbacteria bacterium RIFOXYD2_FULL_34_120]